MLLTAENYRQGFLVDEELMAGITEVPEHAGQYSAFVLRHTTGEYLGYQPYPTLAAALEALNRIPRAWAFEKTSGCGGCGKGDGSCGTSGGKCGAKDATGGGSCSIRQCEPPEAAQGSERPGSLLKLSSAHLR